LGSQVSLISPRNLISNICSERRDGTVWILFSLGRT